MTLFRSARESARVTALVFLAAAAVVWPASAGVVADMGSVDSSLPYAIAADYSGMQTFGLENPGSLDALSGLALTLSQTGFLMTGNSAWSGSGTPQVVVVASPLPADLTAVPEPVSGGLCAAALLLVLLVRRGNGGLQRLQLPVKVQELRGR